MAGKKSLFAAYVPVTTVSKREKITLFLVYAKEVAPDAFVSYEEITQRIYGGAKAPGAKSLEVQGVKNTMSSVRRSLMAEPYLCGLATDPIYGARATTGDGDLLETQMVRASRGLKSAQSMFTGTADLIDPRKIPNTPRYKELKTWFNQSVQPVVKAISSTDFAAKLLPPKRDPEK